MDLQITGLTEIEIKPDELLKEWTDSQYETVKMRLWTFFKWKTLHIANENKNYYIFTSNLLDEIFGLPYTSSGLFAALWNTNSQVYIDSENVWNIEGFALTTDECLIIYTQDVDENEKYFQIN